LGVLLCADACVAEEPTPRQAVTTALPADQAGDTGLIKQLGDGFGDYHTPHFTIISDADPQQVARLSAAAEDTLENVVAFANSLRLALRPPTHKMTVVFFDQWEEYHRFAGQAGFAVDQSVPGFFDDRSNRCLMFNYANAKVIRQKREELLAALREQTQGRRAGSDVSAEELSEQMRRRVRRIEKQIEAHQRLISRTVVRHEIAHQVLLDFGLQPRGAAEPRWLREGLAMQFEERGGLNQHRLTDFLAAAGKDASLHLRRLVGDPKQLGPGARDLTARYARAWMLVYDLIHERPEKFGAYLRARLIDDTQGKPNGTAIREFEAFFGPLDHAFEKRLWAYARKLAQAGT